MDHSRWPYLDDILLPVAVDSEGYEYFVTPFVSVQRKSSEASRMHLPEAKAALSKAAHEVGSISGPSIGRSQPLDAVRKGLDKELVYMIQDGDYVKMVSSSCSSKYFEGSFEDFDPDLWYSYSDATPGSYELSLNTLESLESDMLYGSNLGRDVQVEAVAQVACELVYMASDKAFVKMVAYPSGESRIFKGVLGDFSPELWESYTLAKNKLKFGDSAPAVVGSLPSIEKDPLLLGVFK